MRAALRAHPDAATDVDQDGDVHLGLLRGFQLAHRGVGVDLPPGAQRVVAYLAVHDRPVARSTLAAALWQDSTDVRAGASLRSALWRLNQPALHLVRATGTSMRLAPHVVVDMHRVEHLAHGLLDRSLRCEEVHRPGHVLGGDFLPDWPDDWALVERERFRQLRLHALEAVAERLTEAGRFGQAIDAGLAAVAAEPLRESAHRVVITAYLAEGNRGEALRQYETYRRLAAVELGVVPSPRLRALVVGDGVPAPRPVPLQPARRAEPTHG